ncbi:MAG: tight adherence protein C [Rhodothermales bacterium]|jgi:tight adherence protein C
MGDTTAISSLAGGDLLVALFSGLCFGGLGWLLASWASTLRMEKSSLQKASLPVLFKALYPLGTVFLPFVRRPALESMLEHTDKRLTQAGMDQAIQADQFTSLRIIHVIVFFLFGSLFMASSTAFHRMFGLFLMTYGLCFPMIWLSMTIKKRHASIQRSLPGVLDLLTLSVEAGRDFMTALQDILAHRPADPLGQELERVFREVRLGEARRDALAKMGKRVGQNDLIGVVDALVQADELGVSIGSILRILGDQMRQKRFFYAEKKANEAPVKLLVPLILFIFPAVLVVMLGPILLHSLKSFF